MSRRDGMDSTDDARLKSILPPRVLLTQKRHFELTQLDSHPIVTVTLWPDALSKSFEYKKAGRADGYFVSIGGYKKTFPYQEVNDVIMKGTMTLP